MLFNELKNYILLSTVCLTMNQNVMSLTYNLFFMCLRHEMVLLCVAKKGIIKKA